MNAIKIALLHILLLVGVADICVSCDLWGKSIVMMGMVP